MKKIDNGYWEPPDYIEEEWDFLTEELHAVQKKIYDAVCADYMSIKAENARLSADAIKLRSEIRIAEMEKKDALDGLTDAIDKGVKEYISRLFGGWMVGEEAFFLQYRYQHKDCPSCGGSAKVEVKLADGIRTITCPSCLGARRVNSHKVWNVASKQIDQIDLSAYRSDKGAKRSIKFESEGRIFESANANMKYRDLAGWELDAVAVKTLYKTREEAQAECDKRNKAEEVQS